VVVFSGDLLGLFASVSVGGLVALAVWVILGQLAESPASSQYVDEAGSVILKGFEDNIQRNAGYLKTLVHEHFDAALASLEAQGRSEVVGLESDD
jgi:hypothetical protein